MKPLLETGFAPNVADIVGIAGIFVDRFKRECGRASKRESADLVINLAFNPGHGIRAMVIGGRGEESQRSWLSAVQVFGNQMHALGRHTTDPGAPLA